MKKLPNIINIVTQNRDVFYILSQETLNGKSLAYVKTASASRQCRLFFILKCPFGCAVFWVLIVQDFAQTVHRL